MMLHRLKLLQKLGMDSMYYYGLHYEFLGLIEKIVPVGGGIHTLLTFLVLTPVVVLYKKVWNWVMKRNDQCDRTGV